MLMQQLYLSKVSVFERSFENLSFLNLGSQNNSQKTCCSKLPNIMACICHNIYASQNRNSFNLEAKFNSETWKYTGKIIYTNAYFIYLEIDSYFLEQIKK